MLLLYLIACVPAIVGGILWLWSKKFNWQEWLLGTLAGFLVAGIFHLIACNWRTGDIEMWSGRIVRVIHIPYWEADWWETETYECGDSKHPKTCTRLVHRHKNHPPTWDAVVNYGEMNTSYSISEKEYNEIVDKFGGVINSQAGHRPNYDKGDKNDYYAENHTNYTFPANTTKSFTNNVKASPSIFSFIKVSDDIPVFEWPESESWRVSNRLLGLARKDFSLYAWDQLNAELGPSKCVNVICIGFDSGDSILGQYQQAKWVGGKKNDLVICYGPKDKEGRAIWAYVFGWTDSNLVKANLENLFTENKVDSSLLPKIKEEIRENYVLKDWDELNKYIKIEPPTGMYFVMIFVMLVTQIGYWIFAYRNEFQETVDFNKPRWWRRKKF